MGFIMGLKMMGTVQEEEEEGGGTAAFCGSTSRCVDGGHNPVWFHFKRSGRGTQSVKLMRQVQRVSKCVMVPPSIFQLAYHVCVSRVGRTLLLAAEFYSNSQRKMGCL